MLDHGLQAQAHAEGRADAGRRVRRAARSQPKSDGRPGPGESTTRSGAYSSSMARVEPGPQSRDLGALLGEVAGERVHEGVLVIDEQHPDAGPGRGLGRGRALGRGLGGRKAFIRRAFAGRSLAWASSAWRSTSSRARALSRVSASSADGSESNSSVAPVRTQARPPVMRAVRSVRPVFMLPSKPSEPTAPPYQRRGVSLVVLDELHRPGLRCAGDRHRPHVGEERVERVEAWPQPALDVVDGVDHAGCTARSGAARSP